MQSNISRHIAVVLVAMVLVILFMAADYLALHDIRNDYVSRDVLGQLSEGVPQDLPSWSETREEWTVATVSFAARLVLTIVSALLLLRAFRMLRSARQ